MKYSWALKTVHFHELLAVDKASIGIYFEYKLNSTNFIRGSNI